MQGTQTDNSVIKNLSRTRNFLTLTLVEEMKPAFSRKYDFEHREEQKLNCFFLEVSDYQDTDTRKKNKDFFI